jgi:Ca2+-transporting ATPase
MFAQTFATLGAFIYGLWSAIHVTWSPHIEVNPVLFMMRHNWDGVEIQAAQTMSFVTLSLCELFRAFTVRSERLSIFTIGPFSNLYMVWAFLISTSLLLVTVFTPFLNPIFNTVPLTAGQWGVALCAAIIPAAVEEILKRRLRSTTQPAFPH